MTYDLPTVPPPPDTVVVSDLYTVSCTADATPDALTVRLTVQYGFDPAGDNRSVGEVAVFVNGAFRVGTWSQPYPAATAAWSFPAPRTAVAAFAIGRAAFGDLVPPGACEVSVRVATQYGQVQPPVCYLRLRPTLPPRPLPTLTPGVLRSLFWSPSLAEWQANPGLVQQFRDAGVNGLTAAFFPNPADSGRSTLDRDYFTRDKLAYLQFCRDHGFQVLLAGDDLCRSAGEKQWITTAASAHDDVVWAAQQLAAYADVIAGVELVDEGGDPAADPAYTTAITWLREGFPGVRVGIPNQGAAAWDSGPWVDYQSRYWSADGVGYETRPSLGELAAGIGRAVSSVNRSRPLLLQVGLMGAFYDKRVPGANYTPGLDRLRKGPSAAHTIPAQVWLALAHGACGLRGYAFDFAPARTRRPSSPVGTENLETGVYPGDDRWPGLAAAYTSVARREDRLLTGWQPPVTVGAFTWGVRDQLQWAVNVTESPAVLPLAGTLVTPAGETPFAGGVVPPGGVVVCG